MAFDQASQWYGSFAPDSQQHGRRQSEFLNYFGRLLVTALFLERRLTSLAATGVIDFLTQPPQHDLHALYLDDVARQRLYDELLSSFGRAVWPDMSRGNMISLKVSEEGLLPTPEERLSHKKMAPYRSIETEGDGMKSYVATCVSLLLGRRPVCLIDEPEMCLHPPQAYNLGRFIGRFGTGVETVTFVATHSSHLLRGIIQTATAVQIVRLTRRDQRFSAHLVPARTLTEAVARPTVRAEAVLDGIFAQAVVVLEADTDRVVYQATWETLLEEFRTDVHFSTVGGTGGIAETCRL
jgi:AAA domain, putative AbiEii toxin, Type IV TA system